MNEAISGSAAVDEAWWQRELKKQEAREAAKKAEKKAAAKAEQAAIEAVHSVEYVTAKSLEQTIENIGNFVAEVLAPLKKRNEELEARIAELEARPQGLAYGGTWTKSSRYMAGHCATHGGALWFAVANSKGCTPGGSEGAWKLMAKSGQPPRAKP